MKVEKLIKELQKIPPNMEVCIGDWRKNLQRYDGDPCGAGIIPDFRIELVTGGVSRPFVSLSFDNDDYKDDGTKAEL